MSLCKKLLILWLIVGMQGLIGLLKGKSFLAALPRNWLLIYSRMWPFGDGGDRAAVEDNQSKSLNFTRGKSL